MRPAEAGALLGKERAGDPRQSPVYEAVTSPYRRCPSRSPLQRAQYADLKVYLPNLPLVKVDRMSMHHSLEIRSPLLDRRIVEMAFRIPSEQKMPGLRAKYLLRQLARGRLPDRLLSMPKQGFSTPIGEWIAGPCAQQFLDEVLSPNAKVAAWLDVDRVRTHFEEHCRGSADHSHLLWATWVLERWHRLQSAQISDADRASVRERSRATATPTRLVSEG